LPSGYLVVPSSKISLLGFPEKICGDEIIIALLFYETAGFFCQEAFFLKSTSRESILEYQISSDNS